MRINTNGGGVTLWLSARDTYDWAHKPRAAWPCSTLADHRLVVVFDDHGDMVDLTIDGKYDGMDSFDVYELDAIVEDHLGSAHPDRRMGWEPPARKR
jgi:hypothetical protein